MLGTSIKLNKALMAKVKKCADAAEAAGSPTEFVEHVLEKELAKVETSASDEEIAKKLQGLGYLDWVDDLVAGPDRVRQSIVGQGAGACADRRLQFAGRVRAARDRTGTGEDGKGRKHGDRRRQDPHIGYIDAGLDI